MKKVVLALVLAIIAVYGNAQQNSIVFTEYGTDTILQFPDFIGDWIWFDVDFDGEDDMGLQIEGFIESFGDSNQRGDLVYRIFGIANHWEQGLMKVASPYWDSGNSFIQSGDLLASCPWNNYFVIKKDVGDFVGFIGTRKQVEEGYLYGWIEFKAGWMENKWGQLYPYMVLYGTAFCTMPNYPLLAGQTRIELDVKENQTTASATICPNPTNGYFTILGENLWQAEVINTIGQCVSTVQGEGKRLSLNISSLPTGLYFVNITDNEGRKCVRKVVKK